MANSSSGSFFQTTQCGKALAHPLLHGMLPTKGIARIGEASGQETADAHPASI
ncbi:MAG: hypothetical protein WCG66_02690 [bacterium]